MILKPVKAADDQMEIFKHEVFEKINRETELSLESDQNTSAPKRRPSILGHLLILQKNMGSPLLS